MMKKCCDNQSVPLSLKVFVDAHFHCYTQHWLEVDDSVAPPRGDVHCLARTLDQLQRRVAQVRAHANYPLGLYGINRC